MKPNTLLWIVLAIWAGCIATAFVLARMPSELLFEGIHQFVRWQFIAAAVAPAVLLLRLALARRLTGAVRLVAWIAPACSGIFVGVAILSEIFGW